MRFAIPAAFAAISLMVGGAFAAVGPRTEAFDAVVGEFDSLYAFKDYKRARFGWDLDASAARTHSELEALGETVPLESARAAVRGFFDETRDIHVGVYFEDPRISLVDLPLSIRSAGDRFYLVDIDRTRLPASVFPFSVGDEVVAFDGRPVAEALAPFLPAVFAQERTQRAFAERALTSRPDYLGRSFPTGEATLSISLAGAPARDVRIPWTAHAKEAPALRADRVHPARGVLPRFVAQDAEPRTATEAPVSTLVPPAIDPTTFYSKFGGRRSFVPDLGPILWSSPSDSFFRAYVSLSPAGHRIGYVRVPTYLPDEMATKGVPEFYALMEKFADEADILVYDQVNNGGGSALYVYDLLRALIDRPVRPSLGFSWIMNDTLFEIGMTWKDLHDLSVRALSDPAAADRFANEIFYDKVVDRAFIRQVVDESADMLRQLADPNHGRLSRPAPLHGVSAIEPKPGKVFAKPMLMLINEWSISAADMAPAVFQDLGRAVLFGAPTAGAGAYVIELPAPASATGALGIASYAVSMAMVSRAGGTPIENESIRPDVPYSPTAADFRDGMRGYGDALLATVDRMLAIKP